MFERTAFLLLTILAPPANAAIVDLPRTDRAISTDGVLDENAWDEALRIRLDYENDPGENTAAPVETTALLIEDGENLYVAFEAHDPDPDNIRAWLRDRDSLGPSDFVGISLDTYNDGRRAFEFFTNPLGVQLDRTSDDVNGRNDSSWDAIWESAGEIGDDGYVVEMRIPLDQLSFQDVDGEQVWGFRVVRGYPREREVSMSNMSKNRDRNCKICQYPKLSGFAGSRPGRRLELVPTLTAVQVESTDDPGFTPMSRDDVSTDVGLTASYGITPEITASLALNPDFSQIEADGVQLDINNRFSLVFPERRPFFLEGADYFSTPLQMVFTRTVVDPAVAANLTGKRGAHTIAAFAAQDEVTSLLFPGPTESSETVIEQENTAFVGRYGYGFGGASTIGGLLTARQGDGYRNVAGGIDTRWRINDHHELVAQLLRSETEYPQEVAEEFGQSLDEFGGNALLLEHSFETREWFAEALFVDIDDAFRADSGLIRRGGTEKAELSVGRKWQSDRDWWTKMRLRGAYETLERDDGQLLEDMYIVQFTLDGPWQSRFDVNMRRGREYDEGLTYDVARMNVATRIRPADGIVLGLNTRFGDEIDVDNGRLADQRRINPFVNWHVNRHLLLRLNGSRVEFDSKAGDTIFDASVVDARLTWQFSLRSYVRLTLQQTRIERNQDEYVEIVDSETKEVGRQLLYSWELNPQTVFFLGYSDAYVDNDAVDSLVASDRTWFMKVGYAWAM